MHTIRLYNTPDGVCPVLGTYKPGAGYATDTLSSLECLAEDLLAYAHVEKLNLAQIQIIPKAHPFWAENGMNYQPATPAQQSEFSRLAKEKGLELIWTKEKD